MKKIFFELCGETLEAAQAAQAGGADRVELCAKLRVGGVTPDASLVEAAVQAIRIPVHVLVRPRGGHFVYSHEEFGQMLRQIQQAKQAGAQGVVTGVLSDDGTVDVDRSRELVEAARPMKVTFHRAFDECPHMSEALERVIQTGADYLLTSGGAADLHAGALKISELNRQARGRVQLIGGGGLRLDSLATFIREAGVPWVHGSLLRGAGESEPARKSAALRESIDQAVRILQSLQGDQPLSGEPANADLTRG